jgi:hypothetical protein
VTLTSPTTKHLNRKLVARFASRTAKSPACHPLAPASEHSEGHGLTRGILRRNRQVFKAFCVDVIVMWRSMKALLTLVSGQVCPGAALEGTRGTQRGSTASALGLVSPRETLPGGSPGFIRFTAGLLVALAGVFVALNSWAVSYDVYLLAGQSNMDGMGLYQ